MAGSHYTCEHCRPKVRVNRCIVVSMHHRLFPKRLVDCGCLKNLLSPGSRLRLLFHLKNVITVFIYADTTHGFCHSPVSFQAHCRSLPLTPVLMHEYLWENDKSPAHYTSDFFTWLIATPRITCVLCLVFHFINVTTMVIYAD